MATKVKKYQTDLSPSDVIKKIEEAEFVYVDVNLFSDTQVYIKIDKDDLILTLLEASENDKIRTWQDGIELFIN